MASVSHSASLINFPRRTSTSSGLHRQGQQAEEQPLTQNSSNDQNSVQASSLQLAATNGITSVNNSLNAASAPTSASTIVGLLHQNSMNSRQENLMNNASPYGGNAVQIPSAGSSTSIPQSQPNSSSPFPSPTMSASNNPTQTSHNLPLATSHLNSANSNSPANILMQQQPSQSNEADPRDSQSSVQQIIEEMIMSSQLNGGDAMVTVGSLGNDIKSINGIGQTGNTALNGGNCLVGNGIANGSGLSNMGFGNMSGIGPPAAAPAGGFRAAMANNSMTLNGRIGMSTMSQEPSMKQQDMGSRLLSGLGSVNSFNNLQFD